jgi:transcription termination factor Rho
MSVLDRGALENSPLADLHAIASELSIDGYRRLRREQLIDAILARQEGAEPVVEDPGVAGSVAEEDKEDAEQEGAAEESEGQPSPPRRRGRRGGRARTRDEEPAPEEGAEERGTADEVVEGAVEILPNGSGFLRANPPEESEDDVYISAAQVRRCELITGDRIAGPRRQPRRSERFASLYRVDTINGKPAAELADRPHFDELPAAFPQERFEFGSDDPTLQSIERLTPIGKGSRVTIVGPARAGKSETLKRLSAVLGAREDLHVLTVLAGVRPEEIADWPGEPAQTVSFASSAEAHEQAVASAIDQARRVATRGVDAVVLIDTLDGLHPHAARRALAAARNLRDGASVTVIATASQPLRGETTVIALDPVLTASGSFPALDLAASGTIRPELLVGEDGAAAIREARTAQ